METFAGWLHERWSRIIALLGTLSLGTLAALIKASAPWVEPLKPGATLARYADCLPGVLTVIAVFVLVLYGLRQPRLSDAHERPSSVVLQFHRCWLAQWIAWFVLYAVLATQAILKVVRPPLPWPWLWSIGEDVLSNTQTALFVLSYLILSVSTVEKKVELPFESTKYWVPTLLVLVAAIFVEALLYAIWQSPMPSAPVVLLSKLAIGFASAVGMALFIGRLESRFFNLPSACIALLYFYAALQVLYPMFGLLELDSNATGALLMVQPVVIAVALPLKVLLFLVVYWALSSGRMLFYLEKFRGVAADVEYDWKKFQHDLDRPPRKPTAIAAKLANRPMRKNTIRNRGRRR